MKEWSNSYRFIPQIPQNQVSGYERRVKCKGEHVCKNCNGTGTVGHHLVRKCLLHTETEACDFMDDIVFFTSRSRFVQFTIFYMDGTIVMASSLKSLWSRHSFERV